MQKSDPEVEKRIETLKEDVIKMLSNAAGKATLEELSTLIDALQRLGVAYHFEYQINQALQSIYNNNINGSDDDDLYTIALRFRLLRQQGYSVSSDVFKKYVDDNGEFKATLANDARALLCLFESSNLRKEGEDILEQLQRFSTRQLKLMLPHLNSSFAEEDLS
ncbi:valencene synthase-like [Pistacia vera]|uniref:valencene synthase-like n=1 Tax=Pistacia vera TaxID=55513 RepID=UPI001262EFBF|nr:valencene synthase-like [Pistacia vera]